MRRLIHSLGRWRATHCDTCGRRITGGQSGIKTGHGRLAHLAQRDCARSVAR